MLFGIEFCTKSPRAHMSISPQSGARGLKYPYFNAEKWKSKFNLGFDAAENTHRIKKKFK